MIFGNLGQDDIIGGSSDLYGFTAPTLRPDGKDLIFGGAGTDVSRNNIGDATIDANGVITVKPDGHSLDADTILGDNGRILRLVGVNGTPRTGAAATMAATATGANGVASTGGLLNYNYDNEAVGTGPGYHRIVVRATELLDYTPGGIDWSSAAATDRGGDDELHGESGDDFVYGKKGNDVLFGEGQDDDLIGGWGNDWISGGTGDDGVIGDDGRFMTSRNSESAVPGSAGYLSSLGEALNGVAKLLPDNGDTKTFNGNMLNEAIATPGKIQQATIHVSGALKKAVNLTPFSYDPNFNGQSDEFTTVDRKTVDVVGHPGAHNADDIIFGGLGSDWLHGGSGDDAMMGGEALVLAYTPVYDPTTLALTGVTETDYAHPFNPADALRFNPLDPDGWHFDRTRRAGEFALYDEYDPRRIVLLNNDGTADKTTVIPASGVVPATARQFFLNFDKDEGVFVPAGTIPGANGQQATSYPAAYNDGDDRIFGDTGNDWLVGGTGRDDTYGGLGNDLLNADDNHSTNGGAQRPARHAADLRRPRLRRRRPRRADRKHRRRPADRLGRRVQHLPGAVRAVRHGHRQPHAAAAAGGVPVRAVGERRRRSYARRRHRQGGHSQRRAGGRAGRRAPEGRGVAGADRRAGRPAGRQHPRRQARRAAHAPTSTTAHCRRWRPTAASGPSRAARCRWLRLRCMPTRWRSTRSAMRCPPTTSCRRRSRRSSPRPAGTPTATSCSTTTARRTSSSRGSMSRPTSW